MGKERKASSAGEEERMDSGEPDSHVRSTTEAKKAGKPEKRAKRPSATEVVLKRMRKSMKPASSTAAKERQGDADAHDDDGDHETETTHLGDDGDRKDGAEQHAMEVEGEADADVPLQPLRAPRLHRDPTQEAQQQQLLLPKWMAAPEGIEADISAATCTPIEAVTWLSGPLRARLAREGVTTLFPVQSHVGPSLVNGYALPFHPGDVCVSAPTGSGKTLAYVLPIVECLRTRVVRRLRALIVLPTRELVQQVKQVFHTYCQGIQAAGLGELRVAAITGQSSFAKEQSQLVDGGDESGQPAESRVDILIATPGRLVDHIKGTPNFTLEHVRFLVIDEADRLLMQAYQDWLSTVQEALHLEPQHSAAIDGQVHTLRTKPSKRSAASEGLCASHVRKLLFSATLTHDPETLAYLRLVRPQLFAVAKPESVKAARDGKEDGPETPLSAKKTKSKSGNSSSLSEEPAGSYSIPASLREHRIVCEAGEKPLVMRWLLEQNANKSTLVFTSSVEATHRLFLLLSLMGTSKIAEFSSSLTASQRNGILSQFRAGKLLTLVCSDAMSRGIDVEGVQMVVNYDPPSYVKTYIHRIGRTARAGAEGASYTILRKEEVHHFKALRREINDARMAQVKVDAALWEHFVPRYQNALEELQLAVKLEQGKQRRTVEPGASELLKTVRSQIRRRFMDIDAPDS